MYRTRYRIWPRGDSLSDRRYRPLAAVYRIRCRTSCLPDFHAGTVDTACYPPRNLMASCMGFTSWYSSGLRSSGVPEGMNGADRHLVHAVHLSKFFAVRNDVLL